MRYWNTGVQNIHLITTMQRENECRMDERRFRKSFDEDLIHDCPIKTIAFLFQDDSWMHRELDTYK